MTTKARMVIFSLLSDVQEWFSDNKTNDNRINFAKFIIIECDGDTNKEIDVDELYDKFEETRFFKV